MSEILSLIDVNSYGLQSMVAGSGGGGTINLQDKTVTPAITQQIVTADNGYDGLHEVTVEAMENLTPLIAAQEQIIAQLQEEVNNKAAGEPNLQSKEITITQNGTTTVEPDSGYDGLSDVDVTVNVPKPVLPDGIKFGQIASTSNNMDFLSDVDSSNMTDMSSMFRSCSSLTTVPLFDTSNVTNMQGMLQGCSSLTTVPLFDTSKVTNMQGMFTSCSNLTSVPLFNTSNVTNMQSMLYGCSGLTSVPLFNTSNVDNMKTMLYGCSGLTSVPLFDTSNVTDISGMLQGCSGLITVPLFDTSNVTNMQNMCRNCSILTTVPLFDTSKVTNMGSMFSGDDSLSNESLNNILKMCSNSNVTQSINKTLRQTGLSQAQATTCQTLSNWGAFVAAGWRNTVTKNID